MLEVGNEAPKFSALDQGGNTLSLVDFVGSWVLFWWYPKASTPGWTIQGQGLRDRASEFSDLGAVIVGASFDTVEEQNKFFDEQDFSFPLIADPDRKIGELYGVARPSDDPAAAFAMRTSFLISPEGLVAAIWNQDSITDFQTHGDEVLSVIRSQSWEQTDLILPLEGLSVVEGSAFVAAPSGGMTLAQMGAEVIRFDQLGGGIDYRRWPLTENGVSLYWNGLNRGKKSVVADLRAPEIQILLSELIATSGNFLTNFPLKGWLSYEKLSEKRSDLVMVSIMGSHDGTTAVDYTINCAVGIPSVTGHTDDPRPVNHSLPAWDLICGQTAALGMVAADRYRTQTGKGQLVSLALSDVALAAVAWRGDLAEVELGGVERKKLGNELYGAFGRDFLSHDGRHVMVVAITQRQWDGLLEATQTQEEVASLSRRLGLDFTDEGARFEARKELADLFNPWFQNLTLKEISERLDRCGVCWGPYRTFRQMLDEDPRCSTENPMFSEIDQPGVGRHLVPGSPLSFGGPQGDDRNALKAPLLGEHTEQVLADNLKLSSVEIGNLADNGLIFAVS